MQIGNPPESKRKPSTDWVKRVKTLKTEYPGEYGLVGNYSVGVATHIRQGDYPAFLPESLRGTDQEAREAYVRSHWDITTRRTSDGRNDVYVAWVGKNCDCEACHAEV
jgi:hypothetical protein